MAKDVVISNIVTPATIFSGTVDFADFRPGWVYMLTEINDRRVGYSWARAGIQKVTISPVGVAYPGDAAPGTGPRKVTINFGGSPATVIMTLVDNVVIGEGWVRIVKGEHTVAFSPVIVQSLTEEPS